MKPELIGVVLFAVRTVSGGQQKPLVDETNILGPTTKSEWNFNFSSPAPHHFASAYGLLQQWPNTFFPNGHSIVPCEIPPFTNLYHGRQDADEPPSPEWIAFDIEMAYGIMGSSRNSHMLTYQTTRPMKCIYFDGESATLFGTGQMDTQMLHLYRNVSGPPVLPGDRFRGLYEEYARATGLCNWLSDAGLGEYEGIVRMNAGFEMIVCNFASPSLRLVSRLNVTAPLLGSAGEKEDVKKADVTSYYPLPPAQTRSDHAVNPTNPPAPPNWRRDQDREPFLRSQGWGWFVSATSHYGSSGPGETRVKLLSCGIMSYYSPRVRSGAEARVEMEEKTLNLTVDGIWQGPGSNATRKEALAHLTRRRRAHTLSAVSAEDAAGMRNTSEKVLRDLLSSSPNCSGLDWTTMTNEIVQRHAKVLHGMANLLSSYTRLPSSVIRNETALTKWLVSVRGQTHSLILPYLEYPSSMEEWTSGSELFNATYSRCRFHHTRLLSRSEGIFLNNQEEELKQAVEETMGGICNVIVNIGFSVERIWEADFNRPRSDTGRTIAEMEKTERELTKEVERWVGGLEELMAWLGWAGEWVGCSNTCAWDERCFIPMWPLMAHRERGRRPHPPPGYRHQPPPHILDRDHRGPPPPPGGGGGFPGWGDEEKELWAPRCVKMDYIMG
ncbi:hypothetical protein PVAG01_02481 [Phlyctema vagabunda]|uniref:Uncharacterized protein n=1 Tax=Phlyctema vagabunda TaxID=108571 RepID=A0ABR4PQZ2_9HELO